MAKMNYKAAGVDIDAGNEAVKLIKKSVEKTFGPEVLTPLGSFGALYDLKNIINNYRHPVLVQSIDGVGTKIMVAQMMQKFDTIGIDLVSATTNDIVVLGAKPLTLLDYIANDKLNPQVVEQIVSGIAKACFENQIALVGGETAEMPGTYLPGEHDLVGIITGIVEKDQAILGQDIKPSDVLLAFPSSGLHTNGYSLARKLFFEVGRYAIDDYLQECQQSVGEALLEPHLNYHLPVQTLLALNVRIKGMAHITGGGLLENVPRILPADCDAEINLTACPSLPIFNYLQDLGELTQDDLYRTFNMGVGLVMVVNAQDAADIISLAKSRLTLPLYVIGQVVPGHQQVRLL